jgi:hypothetical protein
MRTLKISLLVFILSITTSAQVVEIRYNPLYSEKIVLFADGCESIVEIKCYELESDTVNTFVLLNKIRNFSIHDIIWELTKSEIYTSDEQFKPIGYQIITNIDNRENALPTITNIEPIKDIEVKSKSKLSILLLFRKSEDNDTYDISLEEMDADLIVGTGGLRYRRNLQHIFPMVYLKEAD